MIFSRPPFVRLRSSKKLVVLMVAALTTSLSVVLLGGGVAQAAPQPTTTASCQNSNPDSIFVAGPRAQTFTAQKSGKLTSAQLKIGTDGNYLLQILGVDKNGTPSQVLASKTIPVSGANYNNLQPAVASYDPATAPTLEAGKQYAIGVDNPPYGTYYTLQGSIDGTCPGKAFDKVLRQDPYRHVPGDRFKFDFSVDVTPSATPIPTPTPSTPGPGPTPKPAPQPAPAPAPAPAGPAPVPIVNTIDQSQSANSGPVNQSASVPDNKGDGSQAAQLLQAANTANQQNQQAANQSASRNAVSGPITGSVGQANSISQGNGQSASANPRGSQSAAQ